MGPLHDPWTLGTASQDAFAVRDVAVGPLSRTHLRTLAEAVLHGPVSASLVQQVEEISGGLPGRAVQSLRRWGALGAVVWTSAGLELVSADAGWEEQHHLGRVLRELHRQLTPTQFETMQMIALLQRPVAALELDRFQQARDSLTRSGGEGSEAQPLLDHLSDLGVLRAGHQGYGFRDARLRDATETWTRPSVRRRLASRMLASGVNPPRQRHARDELAAHPSSA